VLLQHCRWCGRDLTLTRRTISSLSPVHTSSSVETTLSNASFNKVKSNVASTKSNIASTLLPLIMSNEFFVKFRPFDKVETKWTCSICFDIVAKKRQQYRSNVRLCRKNRLTCSIRRSCFDIVAGVDGAIGSIAAPHVARWCLLLQTEKHGLFYLSVCLRSRFHEHDKGYIGKRLRHRAYRDTWIWFRH